MATPNDKTIDLHGFTRRRMLNNRYRVDKRIGVGGMAEVYLGLDTLLNREVAIKLMLQEFARDPQFARQFHTEAQAAAQLRSIHIVGVYDVGEHEGQRYIVMEYVHGIDLKQIFEEKRTLAPNVVAAIATQVCEGLEEAHAIGIIHRDIKSANIMIQRKRGAGLTGALGDRLCAKVMDFGIAQTNAFGHGDDSESIMGSAHYISPERIDGLPASAASDLYSLGVVMYEASTGRLPFTGSAQEEIIDKQLNEQPIPPQHLNRNIDDDFEGIVLRLLRKDPSERYPNALSLHQDLEQYLQAAAHPTPILEYPRFWALGFTQGPVGLRGSMHKIIDTVVLGRSEDADIVIPEESVSRKHLRLTPMGMYLEVEDLGSSNGTLVDGKVIEQSALCKAGSCIELGATRMMVGAAR